MSEDPCPECGHDWHGLQCRLTVYRGMPLQAVTCPCVTSWDVQPEGS